jgi:hypothetical protein
VLDYGLPFPKLLPMHDMWLGIVSSMLGRTCFLATPHMRYRRHNLNVTSSKPSPIPKILVFRLQISISILILIARIAIERIRHVFK